MCLVSEAELKGEMPICMCVCEFVCVKCHVCVCAQGIFSSLGPYGL